MIRLRLLFSASMLVFAVGGVAADYSITDVILLPRVYYVGDRVELRVLLRYSLDENPQPPSRTPTVDWGDIHGVTASFENGVGEFRLSFTAFTPGTQSIPPIELGSITVAGIDVFVQSILTQEAPELASPRDPIVLPGTRFSIILFISLLVGLPLLWLFVLRRGVEWFRRLMRRYQEGRPYRRLLRDLKQLTQSSPNMDGRRFYILLGEDFRRYLSRKTDRDYLSATTGEVSEHLHGLIEDESRRRSLVELLHYGDLVKFADRPSSENTRREHVEIMREVIKAIESRKAHRVAL